MQSQQIQTIWLVNGQQAIPIQSLGSWIWPMRMIHTVVRSCIALPMVRMDEMKGLQRQQLTCLH